MRALAAWWRRAWHWPADPPARKHEAAETVHLKRRPVPECGEDDATRWDLRVGPYIDAPRQRGAHRRSPR